MKKTIHDFLLALREEAMSDKKLNSSHRTKVGMEMRSLYNLIRRTQPTDVELGEEKQRQAALTTVKEAVEYLMNLQDRLLNQVELPEASLRALSTKSRRAVAAQTTAESSASSSSSSSLSISSTSKLQEFAAQKSSDSTTAQPPLVASPARVLSPQADTGLRAIRAISLTSSRGQLFNARRKKILARAKEKIDVKTAQPQDGQNLLLSIALSSKAIKKKGERPKSEVKKSLLKTSATRRQIRREIDAEEAAIAATPDSPKARPRIQKKSRVPISFAEVATAISSLPAPPSSSSSTSDTRREPSADETTQDNVVKVLAGRLPTGQGPDEGGHSR